MHGYCPAELPAASLRPGKSAQPAARVLLLLADGRLGDVHAAALREEGWEVMAPQSPAEAVRAAAVLLPDVVFADPAEVSPEQLRRVLAASGAARRPVSLVLAADLQHSAGRQGGVFADDYVISPLAPEELSASIRGCLRRSGLLSPQSAVIRVADLMVDERTMEVRRGDGALRLTITEYRLLVLLMRRAGQLLSRQLIADRVWGFGYLTDLHPVELYVSYLRAKIDRPGPPLLQTVRGKGYLLPPNRRGETR